MKGPQRTSCRGAELSLNTALTTILSSFGESIYETRWYSGRVFGFYARGPGFNSRGGNMPTSRNSLEQGVNSNCSGQLSLSSNCGRQMSTRVSAGDKAIEALYSCLYRSGLEVD